MLLFYNVDVFFKILLDNCIYDLNFDFRLFIIILDNCIINDVVKDELWEKFFFDLFILGG